MPFWNFIRDIFGGRNSGEPKTQGFFDHRNDDEGDSFRNPIWQNDEDDDDMDDFRHPRRSMQFHVYSNPIEIMKYFESQVDNMLKSFMFGFNNEGLDPFTNALPFAPPREESLRDKMLKPGDSDLNQLERKLDTDLDGKPTEDILSQIMTKPKQPQIFSRSITKQCIRKADGTVETTQVVKDGQGNEEVTVHQQRGDKMYTVVTKKDKNGVETKTENFVNMDESELMEKNWLPSSNNHKTNLNDFPWEKFFKPDPKL